MFKKIMFSVFVFMFSGASYGASYYTFEGEVTDYSDETGIIEDTYGAGSVVGNAFSYVYLIDFDKPGSLKYYGSSTAAEKTDSASKDYFVLTPLVLR